LEPFAVDRADEDAVSIAFDALPEGEAPPPAASPPDARLVCELYEGSALYSPGEDRLYFQTDLGPSGFVDYPRGSARFAFRPREVDLLLVSYALFSLALQELLKARGRYPLHAAGLSDRGRGILLPGDSGCGKTTLTLALLRGGFDFLSDDTTFLSRNPEDGAKKGLRLLAFPDHLDLTPKTLGWFPDLTAKLREKRAESPLRSKIPFRYDEIGSGKLVMEAQPRLLLFPEISESERTAVVPMERKDALLNLAPNVWLTQKAVAQPHLEIFGDLVRRCRCYRIRAGRDFKDQPRLIRDLLDRAEE
jgi:hypothetical protein